VIFCTSTKDKATYGLMELKALTQFGRTFMITLLSSLKALTKQEFWELKLLSGVKFPTKILSRTIFG
jgi:hypothetical protein